MVNKDYQNNYILAKVLQVGRIRRVCDDRRVYIFFARAKQLDFLGVVCVIVD